MAAGRAARSRPLGGEDIPAQDAPRARLATGAAAVAVVLGLAAYPATIDGRPWPLPLLLGALAAALQLASLTRQLPTLVPWSAATLVVSYAIALVRHGGGLDPVAPLYGAGLLLAAELSYWSIELARLKALPAALTRRRVGTVAVLLVGGMVLAAATLLVAAAPLGPGSLLRGAGAAAAVATVATLAALVHRGRDHAEGRAGSSGPEP